MTFAARHVAAAGVAVTAGFYFDVTVRFDTDHLSAFAVGAIPKIPLVENQGVILRFWLQRMTTASPAHTVPEMPHLSETSSRLLGS